jgi:hypothetical protein
LLETLKRPVSVHGVCIAKFAAPKKKQGTRALLKKVSRQYAGLMPTEVAACAPPLTLSTSGSLELPVFIGRDRNNVDQVCHVDSA